MLKPMGDDALRKDVVVATAILFRLGLVDYMGHASARVPGSDRGQILIKPRHSETMRVPADLTPDRVLTINLVGEVVSGDEIPPSERFIHTEIYRARPDVCGVVHTHQMYATAFGLADREILPILHVEAPLVADGVPCFPSSELIRTPELGVAVAATLGDKSACHLQGHGIVTVGRDIREAVIRAIQLERLARSQLMVAQLGAQPRVISPKEISHLTSSLVDYQVRWAYFAKLADDASLPANW